MTARRLAGWAFLLLIPLILGALAVLAGQLTEMAVGAGIAGLLCAAGYAGIRLLTDKESSP